MFTLHPSTGRRSGIRYALLWALVAGGAASIAQAQDPWLDLQFSYAPEETSFWSDDLVYGVPGTTVYARVVMHIPETYYGVAGARFNITSAPFQWQDGLDVASLAAAKGNASDGRMSGFDFGNNQQEVFAAGGGRLRIDMKDDDADSSLVGINVLQNTPSQLGTLFNTAKTVTVYKFSLTLYTIANQGSLFLSIRDGGNHGKPDELASFRAYTSASSGAVEVPDAYGDSGTIFLPAPSVASLGMLAICLTRRGRS